MAKLSPAQDKAIAALNNGEFPLGVQKRTIDALIANGYLTEDNTFYNLTDKGLLYLGTDPATVTETATVEEVLTELNTNPWDVVPSLPDGWDMSKRNRTAWEGLSQDEISADILTARPLANRKDKRSGNVLRSKFA